MSDNNLRIAKDSLGDVPVPADKLWSAQIRSTVALLCVP
jgi:fumarate hydratase class II